MELGETGRADMNISVQCGIEASNDNRSIGIINRTIT